MASTAPLYSGKILKKSVRQAGMAEKAEEQPLPYQDVPDEQLRDVIIAEAKREADELRKARLAELDREVERAVTSHVVSATRELNLTLAAASADIAKIVETAVRRITGEEPEGRLIASIVRQAVRERNGARSARVTVSSADYPKLQLARLASAEKDELHFVHVVEDESIARGRVILTINEKNFDISLDTQLDALKSALQLDGNNFDQVA